VESFPDTNVIVRYLVKDDIRLFNTATEYFNRVKGGQEKIVILESVIAECIYVLTKIYKVPKDEAARSLIALLNYRGVVNSDRNELISALTLFTSKHIDIVDCILCIKAKSNGTAVFSFDADLNRIAKTI
jgi:predicted nucleic-acid-binding protein